MNVQALINNISFPKNIEGMFEYVTDNRLFDVEKILSDRYNEWSAPKWVQAGDIMLFFHAKTALATIRKLKKEFNSKIMDYSENDRELLLDGFDRAEYLYDLYGGKIFAIAKVVGSPSYFDRSDDGLYGAHFKGRVFAEIEIIHILNNPIHINEFSDFILVSRQSAITGVFGDTYTRIKELIMSKNDVPDYFIDSYSSPLPLNKIDDTNWIGLTLEYRRRFFLEKQFRDFYVDYFLKNIGHRRTFYSECQCYADGNLVGFIDNAIHFDNQIIFIEVKLNVQTEIDIISQLEKYCNTGYVVLDKRKNTILHSGFNQNFVLVIDIYKIYTYFQGSNDLVEIFDLDELISFDAIEKVSDTIRNCLRVR